MSLLTILLEQLYNTPDLPGMSSQKSAHCLFYPKYRSYRIFPHMEGFPNPFFELKKQVSALQGAAIGCTLWRAPMGKIPWNWAMVQVRQIPIYVVCGSIWCGSLKSEGFGDGCTTLGALPSPSCA